MSVGPIGAELTGSRTVAACWGWTVIRFWKRPTVSWEVWPGTLTTLAFSLTWMACCDPFWIDTGTGPDEPPIGTCCAAMIVIGSPRRS